MKQFVVLAVAIAGVLVLSGCMAGYESTYDQPRRQMTIGEIDSLSTQGVSDSLIIAQIKATHSVFRLSSQDIVQLKKDGVSETVISAMIAAKPVNRSRWYGYYGPPAFYPYDVTFDYWWWGWPYYYPAFYGGFYSHPFHFSHYGGGFYGGRGGRSRR